MKNMQILKYVEDDIANTAEVEGEYDRALKRFVREILQWPSEPAWHSCICVLCYLTVIGHIVLSVNGKCATHYNEFNFGTIFYIIDVTLAIDTILTAISMYYRRKYVEMRVKRRPIILLLIELFSVLPIEILSSDPKVYCTLSLNRSLRIILIMYFNSKRTQEISSGILLNRLIEVYSYLLFLTLLSYAVYCNYQCNINDNCGLYVCLDECLGALSCIVTSVGFANIPNDTVFRIITISIQMLVFYFISAAAAAHFCVSYISYFFNQVNYSSCTLGMIEFLKQLNAPKCLLARTNEEFHLVWSMKRTYCYNLSREGYSMGMSFLHPSMYNELMIDIAWVSFKHSHLFRNVDFHYLRYLANYVSLEYKLPGEYLYIKGEWKNKMIYISSGTIEILSNEDQQSSILSLCEGTLMGACTLMFGYRSSHYIRCKTFCEFHILGKNDFIKASQFFPNEFKTAKNAIYERYNDAIEAQNLAVRARKTVVRKKENVDPYTFLWVKNTLHRLMATDADSTYRHEFQNIYLITEVHVEEFSKLLFTAEFLDMLVVKERLQVDTDSVFVRAQFPYIFQPDSILGIAWQGVITLLIVMVSFTIPYMAFVVQDPPIWYFWAMFGATHIYFLDVLIQLSTATKSRHSVTVTSIATVKARLQTLTFWLDVGSLIPMESLLCILSTVVDPGIKAQLQMNRLLKIYRIKILFDVWDHQFNSNKLLVRYVKYFALIIYLVFFLYCLLEYWLRNDVEPGNVVYKASFIFTKAYIYQKFTPPYIYLPILNISSEVFKLLMFSNIMAGYIMESLSKFQVQEMYGSAIRVLGSELTHKYGGRILRILELEWYQNRGKRLRPQDKLVCKMSDYTYSEFVYVKIVKVLKHIKFFQDFPDDLIYDICEILYITTIPPNEAIVYGGDISKEIILIERGIYNIFNEYGVYTRTKSNPMVTNLLESMMKIPTVNTVTTVTHCRIYCMNANRFRSLLVKHARSSEVLLETFKNSNDIKLKLLIMSRKNIFAVNDGRTRIKEQQSTEFHSFKNLVKNTYEEFDYRLPFENLRPFSFIRYFFMRHTIYPHGKFIKSWEAFRCTCAILTGICTFLIPSMEILIILLILDFTALADIYLRLHLAYYDEKGVLISHPLSTAKHYLKTAFAVDFLGMFPTALLEFHHQDIRNILLRVNKLLQMYRYLGFEMTFIQYKITPVARPYGLVFIPTVLVFSSISSAIIVTLQCNVTSINGSMILECVNHSSFKAPNFPNPIGAIHGQLFAMYMSCSILTSAGIQGFHVPDEIQTFLALLALLGLFVTVTYAGRFITLYSFTKGTLLKYQSDIKSLLIHMNCLKVNPDLLQQLIANYELKWRILRTKDVHDFLGRVSLPLKLDALYDLYGLHLSKISVFTKNDIGFYRNLLPLMTYDVICKGGFLGRTNDIGSDIYIVYNGVVEVYDPRGHLERTLYAGSMFGNMHNKQRVRYTRNFKAATHVEYFHLPTQEFFKILKYYPNTFNEFIFFRSIYKKYIAAHKIDIFEHRTGYTPKGFKYIVFRENTKRMKLWQFFILVFVCYMGNVLNLYQLCVQEYCGNMLMILYIFDAAFLLDYFISSRTAFVDSKGVHITNLQLIQDHWKKSKIKYITRIIATIPFELPFLFLYNLEDSTRYLIFALARSNRYCRLKFVFNYFTAKTYRLNVNIYLMRIGYILAWTILALVVFTATIILPATFIWSDDVYPPIPNYKIIFNKNSMEKFKLYIEFIDLTTDIITFTPQQVVYPTSIKYILLFLIITIASLHLMYLCYSQIYSLVNQCSFYNVKFRDLLSRLDNFMKREDVSVALYDRIMYYIQMRWTRKGTDIYPALMEQAPLYLREEIQMNIFGAILSAQDVFASCHNDLIRQIAGKIRTRLFYIQDYVQFEGVIDECMYFILDGEVMVTTDSGKLVKLLKKGDVFGILQGIDSKAKHQHTYMASKNSMIGILNSNNWKYLLQFYPLDEMKMRSALKDNKRKHKHKHRK